jgi:hypothetical protein
MYVVVEPIYIANSKEVTSADTVRSINLTKLVTHYPRILLRLCRSAYFFGQRWGGKYFRHSKPEDLDVLKPRNSTSRGTCYPGTTGSDLQDTRYSDILYDPRSSLAIFDRSDSQVRRYCRNTVVYPRQVRETIAA